MGGFRTDRQTILFACERVKAVGIYIGGQFYRGHTLYNEVLQTYNTTFVLVTPYQGELYDYTYLYAGNIAFSMVSFPRDVYVGIFVDERFNYPQVHVSYGLIRFTHYMRGSKTSRVWAHGSCLDAMYYKADPAVAYFEQRRVSPDPVTYTDTINLGEDTFQLPMSGQITFFDAELQTVFGHVVHPVLQSPEVGQASFLDTTWYGYYPRLYPMWQQSISDGGAQYLYKLHLSGIYLMMNENEIANLPGNPSSDGDKVYIALISPYSSHVWYWKTSKIFLRYSGQDYNSGVMIDLKDIPIGDYQYVATVEQQFGFNLIKLTIEPPTCEEMRVTLIDPNGNVFSTWEKAIEQ